MFYVLLNYLLIEIKQCQCQALNAFFKKYKHLKYNDMNKFKMCVYESLLA